MVRIAPLMCADGLESSRPGMPATPGGYEIRAAAMVDGATMKKE